MILNKYIGDIYTFHCQIFCKCIVPYPNCNMSQSKLAQKKLEVGNLHWNFEPCNQDYNKTLCNGTYQNYTYFSGTHTNHLRRKIT